MALTSMRHKLGILTFLGLILISSRGHADTCELRLTPEKAWGIFFTQAARPLRFSDFQGTPLEISAALRKWKIELARKLDLKPEAIEGIFRRGVSAIEEGSRSDEIRLMLVRTRDGLIGIIALECDWERFNLRYLDPQMPQRPRASGIYPAQLEKGIKGAHISAFEDTFDRWGKSGSVLGVLTLKIPGLSLSR